MLEVWTGQALEFQGSVVKGAEYIGIHYSTLRRVLTGELQFLPQKAKCDYVIYKNEKVEKDPNFGIFTAHVGLKYKIGDVDCEITDIVVLEDKIVYEINNDFYLNAKGFYNNYNTMYIATKRYLDNV